MVEGAQDHSFIIMVEVPEDTHLGREKREGVTGLYDHLYRTEMGTGSSPEKTLSVTSSSTNMSHFLNDPGITERKQQ